MIYITGDTHADFSRFSTNNFPEQREMSKDDYVIICGDFGGIWTTPDSDRTEKHWLEWLESKPFTILFVDGNHECFDRLKQFKTINYHGGKAHQIRNNIYHLMRGYVFEFEGKKFFTFGGASSQDIKDGILNIEDYSSAKELVGEYNQRTRKGELLRINHLSWWKEELPTSSEMRRGIRELEKVNYAVDYVITHCLPQSVVSLMYPGKGDKLTKYFNDLLDKGLKFKEWHCGHYHVEDKLLGKYLIHYEKIQRLL